VQIEKPADGVDQVVWTGGVGRGRAKGIPRVVKKLVTKSRHGTRDRHPVRMA
jgi:molybdopterin biosynthesis enzyme